MSNHIFINGYDHISNVVNETNQNLHKFRSGEINPLVTSSAKEREKIGGFLPGEQITLAGRTGTGKSAFILRWLQDFVNTNINPSYKDNLIILFDSWEMLPWRHMLRLYSAEARQDVKTILDYKKQMTEEAFERTLALGNRFIGQPIYFRHISQNVEDWVNTKRSIKKANPDKIFLNVVDHTRLITQGNEKSEQELITKFMVSGMKIKLELNMINIFLSQMNRNIENAAGSREAIGRHLPVSTDIFGADSVYQCSDAVIALHRPGFYGLTEFNQIPTGLNPNDPNSTDNLLIECVLKQRDGWTGNLLRRHNLAINEIVDYD